MPTQKSPSQTPPSNSEPLAGPGAYHQTDPPIHIAAAPDEHQPATRFRRKRDQAATTRTPAATDEHDLKLELMLLREENARLKSARRHRPDIGTAIDQLRLLATTTTDPDHGDEIWSALTQTLLIREGLHQTCNELETAINTIRNRLDNLSPNPQTTNTNPQRNGAVA